jgi:hypothetical protein
LLVDDFRCDVNRAHALPFGSNKHRLESPRQQLWTDLHPSGSKIDIGPRKPANSLCRMPESSTRVQSAGAWGLRLPGIGRPMVNRVTRFSHCGFRDSQKRRGFLGPPRIVRGARGLFATQVASLRATKRLLRAN